MKTQLWRRAMFQLTPHHTLIAFAFFAKKKNGNTLRRSHRPFVSGVFWNMSSGEAMQAEKTRLSDYKSGFINDTAISVTLHLHSIFLRKIRGKKSGWKCQINVKVPGGNNINVTQGYFALRDINFYFEAERNVQQACLAIMSGWGRTFWSITRLLN